jgi:RimJ/RimL family protein N-acetyltransferase
MRVWVPPNMCLRDVQDDDHQFLVDLHNDPVVLQNVTRPTVITLSEHMAWWERIRSDPHEKRLVFTVDQERVGFTKFYSIDYVNRGCILGADIHRDHRGKGLAKFMWSLMLEKCFMGRIVPASHHRGRELHRASLMTAEFNEIALRVYKKLGFKEEGRLTQALCREGRYHDGICMYMLRPDWLAMETDSE